VVCQSEDISDNVVGQLVVLVWYERRAVGRELVKAERKGNRQVRWGYRLTFCHLSLALEVPKSTSS